MYLPSKIANGGENRKYFYIYVRASGVAHFSQFPDSSRPVAPLLRLLRNGIPPRFFAVPPLFLIYRRVSSGAIKISCPTKIHYSDRIFFPSHSSSLHLAPFHYTSFSTRVALAGVVTYGNDVYLADLILGEFYSFESVPRRCCWCRRCGWKSSENLLRPNLLLIRARSRLLTTSAKYYC